MRGIIRQRTRRAFIRSRIPFCRHFANLHDDETPSRSKSVTTKPKIKEILISGATCFAGMSSLTLVAQYLGDIHNGYIFMLGSYGATSVLLFAAPSAPFSQPRNVVLGHTMSALVGAATYHVLGTHVLSGPAAVTASLMIMQSTKTLHPPAGGTALLAVLGDSHIHALGLLLPVPVGAGAMTLVALAAVINNAVGPNRRYPTGGWF